MSSTILHCLKTIVQAYFRLCGFGSLSFLITKIKARHSLCLQNKIQTGGQNMEPDHNVWAIRKAGSGLIHLSKVCLGI